MSTNSKNLFTKLIMMAGAVGVSALLSVPALANVNSESTNRFNADNTIAQGMGGNGGGSGSSGGSNNGGDASSPGSEGDASEPGARPALPDSNQDDTYNQDGTTTNDGMGGGQGGVNQDDVNNDQRINPANPDASNGDAFEREPSNLPLPGGNQDGTTTDDGMGGGQGGVDGSQINPANPDAEGGDAFEREPSNRPIPDAGEGSGQSGTYNQQGTTTDDGMGGGQGGEATGVRALW